MDLTSVLPFVISGIICVGVWVGVLGSRLRGWVVCLAGHLSFVIYGAVTDQPGFLFIPPITATGLVVGIVRELRLSDVTINSNPDTIDIEEHQTNDPRRKE